MPEDSTPASTPSQETLPAAELIRTDNFLNEIMGNLAAHKNPADMAAKAQKEAETKPKEEIQPEIQPTPQPEKQPEVKEPQVEVPPKPEETPKPETELLEKRLKDSQSMIGRQANELGILRKQVAELSQKFEADRQATNQEVLPYYEKLLKASPQEVSRILGEVANDPAVQLQFIAKMAQDIVRDQMKPIQQVVEQSKQQTETAKRDKEWYDTHPGYAERQPAMKAFIDSAFPEGLQGADPYTVAHMAYEYAGRITQTAKTAADTQNNTRIAAGRSIASSTNAANVPNPLKAQPKMDALQKEEERVWEQVARNLRGG